MAACSIDSLSITVVLGLYLFIDSRVLVISIKAQFFGVQVFQMVILILALIMVLILIILKLLIEFNVVSVAMKT